MALNWKRVGLGYIAGRSCHCEGGETPEQVAQRICGCQAGWSFKQPALVESVLAHSRGVGTRESWGLFPTQAILYSVIILLQFANICVIDESSNLSWQWHSLWLGHPWPSSFLNKAGPLCSSSWVRPGQCPQGKFILWKFLSRYWYPYFPKVVWLTEEGKI